jgi:hypothetical protein
VTDFMSREEYDEMEAEDAIERTRDAQAEHDEANPPRDEPDTEIMRFTRSAPDGLALTDSLTRVVIVPSVGLSDEEPW